VAKQLPRADAVGGVDPVVGAGQAHVVVDEVLEVGATT